MPNINIYSMTPSQYLALTTKNINSLYFLSNGQLYKGDILINNKAILIPNGEDYPVQGISNTLYTKESGECALWNGSNYTIISYTAFTQVEDLEDRIDSTASFAIDGISFIQKTIKHLKSLNLNSIKAYAFINCKQLIDVDLPNVTTIKAHAFQGCTSLTSINLPNLTTIEGSEYAFQGCTSLTSINLPNLTNLFSYIFQDCTSLTSINLPNLTTVSATYAFRGCTSLTSINLPNLTTIGGNGNFQGCTSLTSINLPNVTSISSSNFQGCTSLTSINLPNLTTIGGGANFQDCTSLTSINLPNLTAINGYTFQGCTSLTTVILRYNELVQLQNISAFNNTPIKSGTGYVYVPDDLVNTYKAATNWKSYKNQIKGISELPNDGGE